MHCCGGCGLVDGAGHAREFAVEVAVVFECLYSLVAQHGYVAGASAGAGNIPGEVLQVAGGSHARVAQSQDKELALKGGDAVVQ